MIQSTSFFESLEILGKMVNVLLSTLKLKRCKSQFAAFPHFSRYFPFDNLQAHLRWHISYKFRLPVIIYSMIRINYTVIITQVSSFILTKKIKSNKKLLCKARYSKGFFLLIPFPNINYNS